MKLARARAGEAAPKGRARRSLKAQALQLLAQRDQSRVELRAKLLRRHERESAEDGGAGQADGAEPAADRSLEIDALLDWLEVEGFLSAERFVESRVHARVARFGNLRIRQELARHGVSPSVELEATLAESELERARGVRERRFAELPTSPREHAAQVRFLAGRGFSADVIQRVLRPARR